MKEKLKKTEREGVIISRNNLKITASAHPDNLTVNKMLRHGLIRRCEEDRSLFVITQKGYDEFKQFVQGWN